jgi:hypothetical protein
MTPLMMNQGKLALLSPWPKVWANTASTAVAKISRPRLARIGPRSLKL